MVKFLFFLILFISSNGRPADSEHFQILELTAICSDSCAPSKQSELMKSFVSACEIKRSIGKCSRLESEHPEFSDYVIKCDPDSICKNFRDGNRLIIDSCKAGLALATREWMETSTDFIKDANEFIKRGIHQDLYVINLFYRAATNLKIPPELKSLIKPKKGDSLSDNALTDSWYSKAILNMNTILSYIDNKVTENNQQFACFTESAKTKMSCYMGGVVFDPIAVAGTVLKAARLASLANKIKVRSALTSKSNKFNLEGSDEFIEKSPIDSTKLDGIEGDLPLIDRSQTPKGFLDSKSVSGKDPPDSNLNSIRINKIERVSFDSKPVEYHLGNPQLGQNELGFTAEVPLPRVTRDEFWYIPPRNERHKVTEISNDGKSFELTSPANIKSYWKVTSSSENEIAVKKVSKLKTRFLFKRQFHFLDGPAVEKLKGNFDPNKITTEELASHLAKTQVKSSDTALDSPIAANNILKMNMNLAKIIVSKKNLQIEDLKNWNKIANEGVLAGEKSLATGVVRGFQEIKDLPFERTILVDLRSTQMNGGEGLRYIPADQVPGRLENLVSQVNSIGGHSSLLAVAKIYQEYITIHPFIDANGRTARALIDFCLTRMRLPPIPADSNLPREVFFKSPDELAAEIWALYSH